MARVTKTELDRLAEINMELKALAAKADPLGREAKEIIAKAAADLRETGKPTAKRGGWLLRWFEKNGSVSWKTEYVNVAGADAATKLTNDAPKKRVLQIDPPATVA